MRHTHGRLRIALHSETLKVVIRTFQSPTEGSYQHMLLCLMLTVQEWDGIGAAYTKAWWYNRSFARTQVARLKSIETSWSQPQLSSSSSSPPFWSPWGPMELPKFYMLPLEQSLFFMAEAQVLDMPIQTHHIRLNLKKQSGKYLCIRMPQNGQVGSVSRNISGGSSLRRDCLEEDVRKNLGVCLEALRPQQLQNQRGLGGQSSKVTEQRGMLWGWLPWHSPRSAEANGTSALQVLHNSIPETPFSLWITIFPSFKSWGDTFVELAAAHCSMRIIPEEPTASLCMKFELLLCKLITAEETHKCTSRSLSSCSTSRKNRCQLEPGYSSRRLRMT